VEYFFKRRAAKQKSDDEEPIVSENPAFHGDQSADADTQISNPSGENPNFTSENDKPSTSQETEPIVKPENPPAPAEPEKKPVKRRLKSLDAFRG